MKQTIFSLLMALLPLAAAADAVEIGGIYYNLITKARVAEVMSMPSGFYSGEVVIPESVEHGGVTYDVTSIGGGAFYNCSGLASVTIPNSVTSIGEWAFYNCSGLTSVNIPNSVTSIGNSAFSSCSALTSVNIPNSVTSIGGGAFGNCTGLTSVTIPNSVTNIDGAFLGCSGLTSVTIPNSVTSIGNSAFKGCIGLTSVTIGSGVTSIWESAFRNCAELTEVYCLAEYVPYTEATAFDGSYIEYVTLHVPASAINAYKETEPWSNFKEIAPAKCATPTVTIADGKLKFSCETEGVEYVYEVTMSNAGTTAEDEVELKPTFRVTVYAQKEGYENSDVAIEEITVVPGDISGDEKVDAIDLTKLIDILLQKNVMR